MQDNFNLQQFVRNNRLLKENIGGYVDMKPLKENPKASIEDDEMDDYEDPLPSIEDVKWFLDAQKFKPKEVMDTEYIATKIYDYYENFAPEFDDEDLDMDEHNMKLAREYQEYYMNKRKDKVKEEIGTAFGEGDIDPETGIPFMDDSDELGPSVDGAISQRHLNQLENTVAIIIEDLSRQGFDIDDVKAYLVNYIKNM
jgi:hypothetical protein